MPSDGDTVITPAQLKAGAERKQHEQQKHVDAASRDRDFIVSTAWQPVPCAVCSQPIRSAGEAVRVRVGPGQLEPRHRACNVGAVQPARLSGSAT